MKEGMGSEWVGTCDVLHSFQRDIQKCPHTSLQTIMSHRTAPTDDEDMPKQRDGHVAQPCVRQTYLGRTKLSSREVASKCVVGDDTKH